MTWDLSMLLAILERKATHLVTPLASKNTLLLLNSDGLKMLATIAARITGTFDAFHGSKLFEGLDNLVTGCSLAGTTEATLSDTWHAIRAECALSS